MESRETERRAHHHELARLKSTRPRILLADDQHNERLAIADLLIRCGMAVDLAAGGEAAIGRVLDAEERGYAYDLALIDCDMPHCDGFEATRAIRIAGYAPSLLPILGILDQPDHREKLLVFSAEMQGAVIRPVTLETLVPLLNRWLPHRILAQDDPQPVAG
ncbi:MAG: response regulator [Sphingomonadaceae bacterium]